MTILDAHQLKLFQRAQAKGLKNADDLLEVGVTYSARQLSPNPHCRVRIIRRDERTLPRTVGVSFAKLGSGFALNVAGKGNDYPKLIPIIMDRRAVDVISTITHSPVWD